jgi:hypothetical protein
MSLAARERIDNLDYALKLLTKEIGDNWLESVHFEPGGTPEYDAILATTWADLESKMYIRSKLNGYVYGMTPYGWITGILKVGTNTTGHFEERIGRLSAVLKDLVKGRNSPQYPFVKGVAAESSVPEGFICNVVDSRLFESILKRRGAEWQSVKGRGQLMKVPIDFGLELI